MKYLLTFIVALFMCYQANAQFLFASKVARPMNSDPSIVVNVPHVTIPTVLGKSSRYVFAGDFSIDADIYVTSYSSASFICGAGDALMENYNFAFNVVGSDGGGVGLSEGGLEFCYGLYGSYTTCVYTAYHTIPLNVWTHVRVQRIGASYMLLINETPYDYSIYNEHTTWDNSTTIGNASSTFAIGGLGSFYAPFLGNIDNLIIHKY